MLNYLTFKQVVHMITIRPEMLITLICTLKKQTNDPRQRMAQPLFHLITRERDRKTNFTRVYVDDVYWLNTKALWNKTNQISHPPAPKPQPPEQIQPSIHTQSGIDSNTETHSTYGRYSYQTSGFFSIRPSTRSMSVPFSVMATDSNLLLRESFEMRLCTKMKLYYEHPHCIGYPEFYESFIITSCYMITL